MTSPLAARLPALVAHLETDLLERGAAVRLGLLAALAGEHVLLIGPPGTAKSELARRLHRAFADARYFERLLTRFSTPEELFGPLSLKALEDDRYERLTEGYLPTAGVAFLDEVFKANSAILNALLTLLNEREFDNGAGRTRTPLISVVAASNEVPVDESLHAFYDRFLLRVPVQPVSDAAFGALLALPALPCGGAEPAPIARAELAALGPAAARVALPEDVLGHLHALRGWLAGQSIAVSDRRWRQLVALLRVAAASEGRAAADALDLWLVPYVVAHEPAQVPAVAQWFVESVLQAAPQDAPWLSRAVEAFEAQLQVEQSAPAEDGDDTAGKLALARSVGGASEGNAMLRIVSETLEAQSRRRWSPVHLAARLAQVDEVLQGKARPARDAVSARAVALARALEGRVWLPPELAARLRANLAHTLGVLDGLLARLAAVRAGFAALPEDASLAAEVPAPVALSA
ncbi:MAG TPA: AAA family ATPase [Burkholderiaceae bacterium]